jgi:NADH-quinone oxidoreductase subunit A
MPIILISGIVQFAVYLLGLGLILFVMYGVAFILGERHHGRETDEIYESGIKATGKARVKYSAQFYLVAMLFVIFDLEIIFLFGWAVAARKLGWSGYLGMLVFVAILVVGLIYEWRMGAIDFLRQKSILSRK